MVEALKARNPIYRPVLRFFLWLGSLEGRSQAWLILGLFFGVRLLRQLARSYPATAPVLYPLIFLYAAFVLLTWIADPLFNLLLRLDRFGRLALSREQIVASNWLAGILGLGLAALAAGLTLGSQTLLLSPSSTSRKRRGQGARMRRPRSSAGRSPSPCWGPSSRPGSARACRSPARAPGTD